MASLRCPDHKVWYVVGTDCPQCNPKPSAMKVDRPIDSGTRKEIYEAKRNQYLAEKNM